MGSRAKWKRNAPCHCGSGRKHKQCHGKPPPPPRTPESVTLERRINEYRRAMQPTRMTAWPLQIFPHPDGKAIVVGDEWLIVPSNQSFHTSLLNHLRLRLNEQWIARQDALQTDDRHVIASWFESHSGQVASLDSAAEGKESIEYMPSGIGRALLLLADDVVQLAHVKRLDGRLMRRLRGVRSFQGARYELLVAALFCRAGFEIEWIAPHASRKTPEFRVTLRSTGESFVVEAKSIHRPEVLHGSGGGAPPAMESSLHTLRQFKDALTHAEGDLPLLVFIDMNLPAKSWPSSQERQAMMGIEHELAARAELGIASEDCSAVFLTNHGWYYRGEEEAAFGGTVTMPIERAKRPVSGAALERLLVASQESGQIPDEEEYQEFVRQQFPEFRPPGR